MRQRPTLDQSFSTNCVQTDKDNVSISPKPTQAQTDKVREGPHRDVVGDAMRLKGAEFLIYIRFDLDRTEADGEARKTAIYQKA